MLDPRIKKEPSPLIILHPECDCAETCSECYEEDNHDSYFIFWKGNIEEELEEDDE